MSPETTRSSTSFRYSKGLRPFILALWISDVKMGSSFFCVHSFWKKLRPDFLLCSGEYSVAQKVESGTAVHGPLDGLQPVDLSLDRTRAPRQRQGSMYGIAVLTQAPGKALEAAGLSG